MAVYYISGLDANLISGGTLSSSSADANFPLTHLGSGDPFEMFRFNAAAADDYLHVLFGASKSPSFCSIHFHNIDSGVTVELRRGVAGGTLVATMTKSAPTFFKTFTPAGDTDWRLKFVGTNSTPIHIGEWVLGVHSTLARGKRWGWKTNYKMPQRKYLDASGQLYAMNLAPYAPRTLQTRFLAVDTTERDEMLTLLDDVKWGAEPLVIVPRSDQPMVLHGRVVDHWGFVTNPGETYEYGLQITEDSFPNLST